MPQNDVKALPGNSTGQLNIFTTNCWLQITATSEHYTKLNALIYKVRRVFFGKRESSSPYLVADILP